MARPLTPRQVEALYDLSDEKAQTGEGDIVFMRCSVAIWAFTIFVDSRRFNNLNTPEWVSAILVIMIVMAIVQSVCAAASFALSLAQKLGLRGERIAEDQRTFRRWDIVIVGKGLVLCGVYMCVEVTLIAVMIAAFLRHFREGGGDPDAGGGGVDGG